MHTKAHLSQNLRLLASSELPRSDVIKQLDVLLVELQARPSPNLRDRVVTAALAGLIQLLKQGESASVRTVPMMTGFDPPEMSEIVGAEPYDPVGLTMGYDSAYDGKTEN
jgi:hypothetical protein